MPGHWGGWESGGLSSALGCAGMGVSLQPGLVPGSGLFPAVAPEGGSSLPGCVWLWLCWGKYRASRELGQIGTSAGCAGGHRGWPSVVVGSVLP